MALHDDTGGARPLGAKLVRVLAPNPSPMTLHGTNSYLLGTDTLAVIDPGPDDEAHLQALLRAIAGRPVSHILVTHAHLDHSPLAGRLAARTGANVAGFGPAEAGRSAVMQNLAATGLAGGGEGVDQAFRPDLTLQDGDVIDGDGWRLEAIHTPGHMGNHLSFAWGDEVFCGDHVMGWASSLVSPPDGDLTDFLASCARLRDRAPTRMHAGHGDPVTDAVARIDWLVAHRNARTEQALDALKDGPADLPTLTARVYTDVPVAMHPAAARNLFAHLVHLFEAGAVVCADEPLSPAATFALP